MQSRERPKPWRRGRGKKKKEANTHRQHVRIVQSHHRILCNNSQLSSQALLPSSRAASPPLRACVTSPAQSLLSVSQIQNLPLSAPARSVCPANPLPSTSFLLLCWPLSLSLSLLRVLPLSISPTRSFLLVSHSLLAFFPSTPSRLFCCCALA